MPVSYTAHDPNHACFLTPAPFVSIDKNYDKAGNGEILGVRYTITLNGTLVADRGSPSTHSSASKGWLTTDGDAIIDDHVHANGYNDIMKKMQSIRNLFSKINEGGRLDIQAPKPAGGGAIFTCYPRIESVSFPEHAAGNPFIQPYTIVLEADKITGSSGADNDDFDSDKINGQYITGASETWDIQENDGKILERDKENEASLGQLEHTARTYTVTHNLSATGKRKFNETTDAAEGLDQTARQDRGNKFWNKLKDTGTATPTGEAWYQAREFVRNQLKHGFNIGLGKDGARDGAENTTDDRDKYGINLPKDITWDDDSGIYYSAFNYAKTENVDELSGVFSVTETWMLAPSNATAVESVDINITENKEGTKTIAISGNIEGLGLEVKDADSSDKGAKTTYKEDYATKYANALAKFAGVEPNLYILAKQWLAKNNLQGFTVKAIPSTRTHGHNPVAGTISYNHSYDVVSSDSGECVPLAVTESLSINDTYPGHTFAQQVVIGRKLGPVLQDIGTQSVWKRTVSMGCTVDTTSPNLCINSSKQKTLHRTEEDCEEDGHQWVDNPNHPDNCSSQIGVKPSMNQKPVVEGATSQRKGIRDLIDSLKPSVGVTAIYFEPPQETWNPKTGAWTYNITWTYELANSYMCNEDVDGIGAGDGDESKEGDKEYPGTPDKKASSEE